MRRCSTAAVAGTYWPQSTAVRTRRTNCTDSLVGRGWHSHTVTVRVCVDTSGRTQVQIGRVTRSVLADEPRVTRFQIKWDEMEQEAAMAEPDTIMPSELEAPMVM